MPLIEDTIAWSESRFAGQKERLEAIRSLLHSIRDEVENDTEAMQARVLERIITPERTVRFRVVWENDAQEVRVNEGYRILQSTLLGPGKGGLRFHRTVNESVIGFLAFEQQFKNALTQLPLGGAKGGADLDPRGLSRRDIRRFCESYMTELARHIGAHVDVPAGDIGVGTREIGFLFGQYRRMQGTWDGVLTGKGSGWGGSLLRSEATGYGLVYFLRNMLEDAGKELAGLRVTVSGAGNVALHTVEKLLQEDAIPVSVSNSSGLLSAPDGITADALEALRTAQEDGRRLDALDGSFGLRWIEGATPWELACDAALPCATQHELDADDAARLIVHGCRWVAEGANMPCTEGAIAAFQQAGVRFAPGKAANAGGVSVSGLEMAQNASFTPRTREEIDQRLRDIMCGIYKLASAAAEEHGDRTDLVLGADVAGYRRLRNAMLAQGLR